MEFDNNTPIYIQVMEMLKKQIVSGELKSGDKLPSVRELAIKLKVNPNTIQRTYQELEREGIAKTQRGLGRYVGVDTLHTQKLKQEMSIEIVNSFINDMKQIGFSNNEIIEIIKSALEDI